MKKILTIFAFLLVFTMFSCNEETTDNKKMTSIETISSQNELLVGEDFDTGSVLIKVTFSDGTEKVYTEYDMQFDLSNLDNDTPGKYRIKVTIQELNRSIDISVNVLEPIYKILMIGNSYSDDTIQWMHEISNSLGIELTVANLYIGGCTLSTHLNNLYYDNAAYEYVEYDKSTRSWSRTRNTSISSALAMEDWAYVSLQQGSHQSGQANTYNDIDDIIDLILEIKDDVKFLWNMTWAYQQNIPHVNFGNYNNSQSTMYNAIIDAVKNKVVTNESFVRIIPNGTAIQNARTSYIGDTLCRDEYCHLTLDLGRYIAGLTMVATVTGKDISGITYAPSGVDNEEKAVAIEAVKNAILNPFEITESIY